MRYFKNKFFIICLTVVLCLTVFSVVLSASGNAWFLKDAVNVISYPFRLVFNYCADGISGFVDFFTEFDRILAENEELRAKNEKLENDKSYLEALKEENEWLRDFLEIKNQNTSFTFADATVIGRSTGTLHRTLTLNRGSLHGIKVGMVVMTEQGLVGKVSEVGLTSCDVLCLTDVSSSIGACIERSALLGIVDGYYGKECRFSHTTGLENLDAIAKDDIVISSGKGSIYPYGLKIGTISDIKIDDASRSVIATVEMAVDFENISRVMIITDFEVK